MSTIVKRIGLSGWAYKPKIEHMVEIEIDEDRLAHLLGEKAFRNKSKKSAMQGGMVKCVIRPVSNS
jgi:hypothetical protein